MHHYDMQPPHKAQQYTGNQKVFKIFWFLFVIFVFYGTLIPFNVDFTSKTILIKFSKISWIPFIDADGTRVSIPDVVQNILLFIPCGFLGFFALKSNKIIRLIIVVFSGVFLSLTVEILQLLTTDRTTSITDLTTNGLGTLIGTIFGLLCNQFCTTLSQWAFFRQYYRDKYFPLLLTTSVIIILNSLHPFDFTLDLGSIWSNIKWIIRNPFHFDPVLRDEGSAFFKFFLFGYVWALWLREREFPWPTITGFLAGTVVGVFSEGMQIIVSSRMPTFQDVVVIICGCFLGATFLCINPERIPRLFWAVVTVFAVSFSAGLQALSPFSIASEHTSFNWIPFLPYYERTTFVALSNFVESMLIFFPMGFILQYFYRDKKMIYIIAALCMVIAFPFEFFQGYIQGRFPDITDVIGAITGGIIGGWISTLITKKDYSVAKSDMNC